MEQQGGSYNPITVVVMKAQRPSLEVRHFWHPLTLLHCKSQQFRSQETQYADYHYTRLVESDFLYSGSCVEKYVMMMMRCRFLFLRLSCKTFTLRLDSN